MRTSYQFIIIILGFILSFIFIRKFLDGVNHYQLNNSAYKKRKKNETFREWLFYSKYKEEIPKILRVLYFSILLIHPLGIIVCVVLYITKSPQIIGEIIAIVIACFDFAWNLIIDLLFWSRNGGDKYERWIIKRRGQDKSKRH